MTERIGLTMRTVETAGYVEPRDCLAQDWSRFMRLALPEVAWVPIPNLGADASAFAEHWALDGLLFTGGEDVGANPLRDLTEASLLAWARDRSAGVFGVCRGLQFLQHAFGGRIEACPGHAGVIHAVALEGAQRNVNSFHRQGVRQDALAPPLQPLALSADGWVEALHVPGAPIVAVQWHPERLEGLDPSDLALLRRVFPSRRD